MISLVLGARPLCDENIRCTFFAYQLAADGIGLRDVLLSSSG